MPIFSAGDFDLESMPFEWLIDRQIRHRPASTVDCGTVKNPVVMGFALEYFRYLFVANAGSP